MKTINIGIMAHVDAGKTTVTEGLLVHSGVKRRMGRVDLGTTTTDAMALERQRGMTIRAATVSFVWEDTKINLIDTPGHMEFIAEVERSLAVLDGVILVLSAREGVQPQTRVIFQKLRELAIPAIFFINKMDRAGVSLDAVREDIANRLTDRALWMQSALAEGSREAEVNGYALEREPLRDRIIEASEDLLGRFLREEPITPAMLRASLVESVTEGRLYPVLMGAALHDIGIRPLLEAVTAFFRCAADRDAPLSAYVYKVEWDGEGHKQLYARVFTGALRLRDRVAVAEGEAPIHVKGLQAVREGRLVPVDQVGAGDIGVLLDAPALRCGDFLGGKPEGWRGARETEPLLTAGIAPENPAERSALITALERLAEEDPFLRLRIHPETGEITLRIFGPLQQEIISGLLLERFGLRAAFQPLKTLFKEQPREAVAAEIRIWKDGNLHEAGIAFTLEPLPEGAGNRYETRVSFGDLQKTFQNGVREGALLGLQEGIGQEIVDTKVTFTDMDFSSVTSTPADYRRLAPLVIQKALRACGVRRLEPWMRYTLIAPVESQRRVLKAMNGLRATMDAVLYGEMELTLSGTAPLDTCKGFAGELLGMTQGQGVFTTEFWMYRMCDGGLHPAGIL